MGIKTVFKQLNVGSCDAQSIRQLKTKQLNVSDF